MSASKNPHSELLRELAGLMVAVAGESVTMVKRSVPEAALKLKQKQEWNIYLEFLKVQFNLADRLSVLYLPIQEQPLFMNGLEDTVTQHLKAVLAPALGPDNDDMEVTLTIGQAVAESRQRYEPFRFLVTEDGSARTEFLKCLSEQVAELVGATGNGAVTAAATLCASSAIAAMKALFEGLTSTAAGVASGMAEPVPSRHATEMVDVRHMAAQASQSGGPKPGGQAREIKLVSVMSSIVGEEVETRWGLHPRFKQDLRPDEGQELTKLMNRVTQILGERYASVAFTSEWTSWNQIGHA